MSSLKVEIPVGLTCKDKFKVKPEHTAKVLGSGGVDVLSTPSMIAFMENVAWKCVERHLPEGYTTVGVKVSIEHLNPVPVGAEVTVEAKLIRVEGRKLVFEVRAFWNNLKVGEGIHERYIVNRAKFDNKVKELARKMAE